MSQIDRNQIRQWVLELFAEAGHPVRFPAGATEEDWRQINQALLSSLDGLTYQQLCRHPDQLLPYERFRAIQGTFEYLSSILTADSKGALLASILTHLRESMVLFGLVPDFEALQALYPPPPVLIERESVVHRKSDLEGMSNEQLEERRRRVRERVAKHRELKRIDEAREAEIAARRVALEDEQARRKEFAERFAQIDPTPEIKPFKAPWS